MYADREEAAMAERKKKQEKTSLKRTKQRENWSYSSSVSRSVSPSRSRSPSRSPSRISPRRPGDVENRERELQEQLRKRAMMSKRSRSSVNASTDQISGSPDANQDESRRSAKLRSSRSPDADHRRTKERSERRQGRRDLLDRHSEDRSDDEGRRSSKRHKSRRDSVYDDNREEEESSKRRRRRKERDHDDDYDHRSSNKDHESRHGGDSESGSHYEKRDRRTRRSSRASEDDPARKSRRSDNRSGRYLDSPRSNGGGGSTRGGYYDPYYGHYDNRYGPQHGYYEHYRYESPPPRRRRSESRAKSPDFDDYELRSIFCSQLAARLTQRDLGEFFEDKLGEGTVMDVRIVMDKVTGRSKGVGYVELKDEPLVEKALDLTGTVLFGIPIIVQKTDAARNKGGEASSAAGAPARPNLPAALSALSSEQAANLIKLDGNPIHIDPGNIPSVAARLYVGNLHFSLTEADIKSVFEPFGAILSVDLHREPGTLKSKGFAFVQFINTDVAEKAIEHMNGFELAGRNIKVNHVNSARASGAVPSTSSGSEGNVPANASNLNSSDSNDISGAGATLTSSFDEGGGGGLTASSRAALMEKLARTDRQSEVSDAANAMKSTEQIRPSTIPQAKSRGVHLKNMFNPEEETERGWEIELAEDIKEECQQKYGKVDTVKVDINSMGEVYIRFADVEGAEKAVQGLNGRFFGGRSISAAFISEGFLVSMLS